MSPPKPPDPAKTAAEQAKWNEDAAIGSTQINQIGQSGPTGDVYYTGGPPGDPNRRQVTTLSPELQELYDSYTGTQRSLMNIVTGNYGRSSGGGPYNPGSGGPLDSSAGTPNTGQNTGTTPQKPTGPRYRKVEVGGGKGGTRTEWKEIQEGDTYTGPTYQKESDGQYREVKEDDSRRTIPEWQEPGYIKDIEGAKATDAPTGGILDKVACLLYTSPSPRDS